MFSYEIGLEFENYVPGQYKSRNQVANNSKDGHYELGYAFNPEG